MVLEAGDDVAVHVDGPQVHRRPEHGQRIRTRERVVEREPDEVAVQAGGEPHGVLVPVQDVEGGRRLAQQVVVDDVVPHEVVRAQPREHPGQRLAVHVAAARGLRDRGRGDVAAHEGARRAGARAVERAHEQRQARDVAERALRREVPDGAGRDDPARARRVEVDRRLLRDRGDGVAGLQHRVRVGVEVEVGVLLVRVAPRDDEDLHPLADEVLDEAAPRREVEDVVLVDRRRDEQQRDLVDLLRRRPVLDELEDLRVEHDRARGGGEVAPHLELRRVDALRQPRRPGDVGREAPRAADQVRAALVDDRAQDGRVRQREVRGRDGVEHVARREARLTLRLPVELGVRDQAVDGLARRQVALHHPAEQPVLLPGGVREAAVVPRGALLGAAGGDPGEPAAERGGAPCGLAWMPGGARGDPGDRARGEEAPRAAGGGVGQQHVERRARRLDGGRRGHASHRTDRPRRAQRGEAQDRAGRLSRAHKPAYDRPAMTVVERGSVVPELAAELLTKTPELARGMADHLYATIPELAATEDDELMADLLASAEANLRQVLWVLKRGAGVDEVRLPPEAAAFMRANVRRGIPLPAELRAYRLGHAWLWDRWTRALQERIADPDELIAAQETSSACIFAYIDRVSDSSSRSTGPSASG